MLHMAAAIIFPLLSAEPVDVAELPKYASCIEWAASATPKDGTVLIATQENGYLFCVFLTGDGKLAFCEHELSPRAGNRGSSLDISDENGERVTKFGEMTPISRQWRIRRPFATAVVIENLGSIYPLVENPPRRIRIRFDDHRFGGKDSPPEFDHVVDIRPNEK